MQPRVFEQFGCGGTRFWLYFQAPQHEGVPTLQLFVGETVLGRLSLLHHEHGALEGKIFSFSTSQEVTCDSVQSVRVSDVYVPSVALEAGYY
jgi:hypothetical protein